MSRLPPAFRPLLALRWRINPSVCSTAVHYILQTAGYRAIADPGCCLHSPEAVLLSQIPVNCQYCFFVFALFTPLKKINISKIAHGIRGHMLSHAVAHLSRHMDCHAHQLRSLQYLNVHILLLVAAAFGANGVFKNNNDVTLFILRMRKIPGMRFTLLRFHHEHEFNFHNPK